MAKKKDATAAEPEVEWSGRKFRHKPVEVEAKQLPDGTWQVDEPTTVPGYFEERFYQDEEFRLNFEPVPDGEPEAESDS
jgi:hypothetical protein